jgi:hypothetical protein
VDIIGKGATLLGAGTTEPDTANPNPTNEIRNCEEDVAVAGDGEHLVKGVTATGLLADSVTATVVAEFGFVVASDNNWIISNVARNISAPTTEPDSGAFQGVGFYVTGNSNWLSENTASDTAEHGFTINGNNNRLDHNVAFDTRDNGFNVDKGQFNVLDSKSASGNRDDGFFVGEAG